MNKNMRSRILFVTLFSLITPNFQALFAMNNGAQPAAAAQAGAIPVNIVQPQLQEKTYLEKAQHTLFYCAVVYFIFAGYKASASAPATFTELRGYGKGAGWTWEEWGTSAFRWLARSEYYTTWPQRAVREAFSTIPRNIINEAIAYAEQFAYAARGNFNIGSWNSLLSLKNGLVNLSQNIKGCHATYIDPLWTDEAYRKKLATWGLQGLSAAGILNLFCNPYDEEGIAATNTPNMGQNCWNYLSNKVTNGLNYASRLFDIENPHWKTWAFNKAQTLYWLYQLGDKAIYNEHSIALTSWIKNYFEMNVSSAECATMSNQTALYALFVLYQVAHQGKLLYKDWNYVHEYNAEGAARAHGNQPSSWEIGKAMTASAITHGLSFLQANTLASLAVGWTFTPTPGALISTTPAPVAPAQVATTAPATGERFHAIRSLIRPYLPA
jgi:hypothetical protein